MVLSPFELIRDLASFKDIDSATFFEPKQNISHSAQIDNDDQMNYTGNKTKKEDDLKQNFSKGFVTYEGS